MRSRLVVRMNGLRERKGLSFVAPHHEDRPMADTEKAEISNIKKQAPRPFPLRTSPLDLGSPLQTGQLGLGAGLESPRSPHC